MRKTHFTTGSTAIVRVVEPNKLEIRGASDLYKEAQAATAWEDGLPFFWDDADCFFFCEGTLNSTFDANGAAYLIEDLKMSHAYVTESGRLIAQVYDENENELFYDIRHDGFHRLDWNKHVIYR